MEKKKVILCVLLELGLIVFYFFFWKIGVKPFLPKKDESIIVSVYFVLLLLSMVLLLFLELSRWKEWKNGKAIRFFVMLLLLGMMYQTVLPAFSAPDEDAHFVSAYRISNQILRQKEVDENGNTLMRKEDGTKQVYTYGEEAFVQYYKTLFWPAQEMEETVSYTRCRAERSVPFIIYFAPACGITAARILHLNGAWTAYFGRMCCLILFAFLAAVSYCLLPFAHSIVMILCTMPMTLSLISAISYDGINLALILVFFSLVMNCAYVRKEVTWKEILGLFLLAICYVPIKLIYVPFLWLILFIPLQKFRQMKIGFFTYGVIMIVPILESLWLKSSKIVFIAAGTTNLTAEDGYTLAYVLQHPIATLKFIAYSVFFQRGDEMVESFAGRSLGWLDTKIPVYLAYSFLFLLLLYVLSEECQVSFLKWQKILVGFAAGVQIGLPMLIMFLAETQRSDSVLACVQGRYFLPIVLLLPILFQNQTFLRRNREDERLLERLLVYMNSLSVIMVLYSVLSR